MSRYKKFIPCIYLKDEKAVLGFKDKQIKKILALRGDISDEPMKDDFKFASDLVKFIKDYEFKTPTAACNVISWWNLNWRLERKNKDWKTLDEMIRKNEEL